MPGLTSHDLVDAHGVVIGWEIAPGAPDAGVEALRRFPAATGIAPEVTWHLAARPGPGPPPASISTTYFGTLRFHTSDAGRIWLVGVTTILEISGDSRAVQLGGTEDGELRTAALIGLHLLLHRRGLFHVHAAGLVRPDGSGLLIPGGSGAGKTTTTLGMLASDPSVGLLSDDTVYLRATQTGPVACAYPSELHVAPDTLRCFPELASHDHGPLPGPTAKRRIEPRSAYAGRERPCTGVIQTLVFPVVTGGPETRLVPLGSAEAYARLISASLLSVLDLPGHLAHLETLAGLARCARSWTLELGADSLQDRAMPGALLASVDPGPGSASEEGGSPL